MNNLTTYNFKEKNQKTIKKWEKNLSKLQNKLNYQFKNKQLLKNALIHKSFYENSSNNKSEIMEFLGDSVLELIVTEFLVVKFPEKNEGELSKLRSKIISKKFLYKKAKELSLNKYILVDNQNTSFRILNNFSLNADIVESLFAAIYLDSSFVEAKYVIKNIIFSNWEEILNKESFKNFKSLLQEWSQEKYNSSPVYKIIKENGPEHKKRFYVLVNVDKNYKAKGKGKSKKKAEQNAARNLLKKLKI